MADAGLPWSIPNAGFSIQPVNGEFAAWSKGSSVPPDGWSVLSGSWPASLSRCQGGTGPWAVDFGSAGVPSTLVSDYIVVLPNTRYLLSALYRIVSGTGAALSQGVRVDWYDDARALISSTNLDLVAGTSGSWTYLGVDTTSPIQAVYAKVVAGRFNVNGSTDLQIDAIKLDRAVYIPSGVISLDDVTDGTTYARPRADGLQLGYPKLDSVVDGTLFKKVNASSVTGGEITSLSRSGTVYATSTFFQKALDNLDSVLDGASFRKVGTAYVDASNRVTGVLRGASPVAGADLFAKTLDTLDNVTDGASFRKVGTAYVDSSNRITGVLRGTSALAGADIFAKTLDTLDNVSNGTTYARVNATALSSGNPKTDSLVDGTYAKVLATQLTAGAVTSLTRGGVSYATTTFFNTGLDNLSNISNGGGFNKTSSTYVNTSGQITSVRRAGADESVDNLFKKSSDTFASVAGTIATSQFGTGVVDSNALGSNSVTTAKIADLAVGAAELDDGISLAAYDEAQVAGIYARTTATNCTKNVYDGVAGFIRYTIGTATTNPQVSSTVYTGTSTTLATTRAVMRYRISAGAANKVTAVTAINNAATAQTATAVFLADGNWHTAVFDISGWTTAGTLRVDLTLASNLATTGYWDISYLGTGNPGSGTGSLASYQGRIGIGAVTPSAPLEIAGAHVASRGLATLTSAAASIAAITFYPEGTYAGAIYGNTDDTVWLGTAGATALNLYTNGAASPRLVIGSAGNVTINKPSSGTSLSVAGTDGSTASIVSASNTAASFPQLQILNYGANGGYPVLATYNARGNSVTPASPSSGDLLGAWVGYGYTLSSFTEGARVEMKTTAAPGVSTLTTALDFWTSNSAASSAKARLSSAGRLYIGGATDAEELLEVRSGTNAYGFLHSNGTIKVGTYISGEGQIGTKSNHDFGIFTNNAGASLRVTAAGEVRIPGYAGGGTTGASIDNNGRIIRTVSDGRLKEDIQPVESALDVVCLMEPISFSWKNKESFGSRRDVGFIAQDVRMLVPEAVAIGTDGYLSLDYAKIVPVLVKAVQELKQQVDALSN